MLSQHLRRLLNWGLAHRLFLLLFNFVHLLIGVISLLSLKVKILGFVLFSGTQFPFRFFLLFGLLIIRFWLRSLMLFVVYVLFRML